jgi:hypothetical protein
LIEAVRQRLGVRQLIWFGTRGDDAESLADLPQFSHVFSLTNAYRRRMVVEGHSLEDLTAVRVDLDAYEIDDHPRDGVIDQFRRNLLGVLSQPSVVVTYRPSTFLSAVCFARRDRCHYLGMFKDHQAAFEHKPWVESAVRDLGLPRLEWAYIADSEQLRTHRYLADGPVMLRRSRSSGGTGLTLVEDVDELAEAWPELDEAFVSVAPFVDDALPVNIGAVVWDDGVSIHPASLQLIGQPSLTGRPFGYCGNDFGALAELDAATVDAIEDGTKRIGEWLRRNGYRGAFGVDYLVKDGVPLFTEVNPRFQGSTHLSAEISVRRDEPCILLEHLAAHLSIDRPERPPLRDYVGAECSRAHLVVHHLGNAPQYLDPHDLISRFIAHPAASRTDVHTRMGLRTLPGGVIARLTVEGRATTDGFDLLPRWEAIVDAARTASWCLPH